MRHDYQWHAALARQARGRRRQSAVEQVVLVVMAGVGLGLAAVAWVIPHSPRMTADAPYSAQFGLCHTGGGIDCVVDGDTFWANGVKIRVADIDAPETHDAQCDGEQMLGDRATARLQALLNAGPIMFAVIDRDEDRYGRKLRVVMRDGHSLGNELVAEGLARPWEGHRRPWC